MRRLTFGPEEQFIKPLGIFLAIFTVPNFLHLDYWQMFHQGETSMAGVYSARDNSEARAMLAFTDSGLDIDYRDIAMQFTELDRRTSDDGWVRPQLLEYMRTAPDFYFDGLAQIIMDRWAQGRVGLVGDAAHCTSPMSGQGTSLALLGAYILAGELAAAGGDHERGFANYDATFRGYVERSQRLVEDDEGFDGAPLARDDFYHVVHSIELTDY
jgi:2-polyprenyl-6-methoxyphenol hydroxylase-like FAD-dependent oxidoreductase